MLPAEYLCFRHNSFPVILSNIQEVSSKTVRLMEGGEASTRLRYIAQSQKRFVRYLNRI